MKTALRDNAGHINWYALSDSRIAELQEIAGRNTGHLRQGVYIINVIDCNGNKYHHKIIKK